jgi:uncharacterized membrane protein
MQTRLYRPMVALVFSSLTACALLASRALLFGHARHLYLVWNLFLAWLPLLLALLLHWLQQSGRYPRSLTLATLLLWLFFFPNASYIFTDVVHVSPKTLAHFWPDLVVVMVFALTGLTLGFVSLYLVQRLVARRLGWIAGWGFVCAVAFLNGFGVYAGRFLRWNSWDVMLDPAKVTLGGLAWLAAMPQHPRLLLFPALFSLLMFVAYVLLYSLTELADGEARPEPVS